MATRAAGRQAGKLDSQLILDFVGGDEEAFNELYHRFSKDVQSVIYNFTTANLKREVEDICQYFWSGFIKYAHSYDPNRPVRAWILSCAVKAAATYRRLQLPRTSMSLADTEKKVQFDAALHTPEDPQGSPEEVAMLQDDFSRVARAMNRIPTVFSNIIQAVYLNCQTPSQYADQNGIPLNTVYTQLHRGMRHLREALSPAC